MFSLFRASGRFIWPVFYLVVVFGLASILRNYRWPGMVLLLALAVQYADLQPLIAIRKFDGFSSYESPLQADFWEEAAQTNRHVMLLPASTQASTIYEPFAIYASRNHMTLNTGYFARADYAAIEAYGNQAWQDLKAGQADADTLYLVWDETWAAEARRELSGTMLVCQVDGYSVLLSPENAITGAGLDLGSYCSIQPGKGQTIENDHRRTGRGDPSQEAADRPAGNFTVTAGEHPGQPRETAHPGWYAPRIAGRRYSGIRLAGWDWDKIVKPFH